MWLAFDWRGGRYEGPGTITEYRDRGSCRAWPDGWTHGISVNATEVIRPLGITGGDGR